MDFGFKTETYYKKMIELQDKLRKSEEERLKLEEKFNEMMRHTRDAEHERLRILRHRYHKFLDDDKLRQDRNEAILRALDRVESRSQMLAAKTDRFKAFRKQYERVYQPKTHQTTKPTLNPQDRSYFLSNTRRKLFSDHSESADAKLAMLEQYLRDNFDNFPPDKTKESLLKQYGRIDQFSAPETAQNCLNVKSTGESADDSKSEVDLPLVSMRKRSSVLGTTIEKELERLRDNSPIPKQEPVEEPYVQDYKELVSKSEEKFGLKNSQFSPKRTVQKTDQLIFDPGVKTIDAIKDNITSPARTTKTSTEVSKRDSCVEDSVNDNPIIKKYKEVVKTLSEDLEEILPQITVEETVPKPIESPKQMDNGRNIVEQLEIAKIEEDNSDRTEPPLDISLSSPIQQFHAASPENLHIVEQIAEKITTGHPEESEKVLVIQQPPLEEQSFSESVIQEQIFAPEVEVTEKLLKTVESQDPMHEGNYPEYPPNQTQYQDYPEQESNQEQYNYSAQDNPQGYIHPGQEQQNYPVEENSEVFNPDYVPNGTYPLTNPEEFDPNYVTENVYSSEANPDGFKGENPVQDNQGGYSDEYQAQISANYPGNQNYSIQEPSGEIYAENQDDLAQEPIQEDNQKYEQAENYIQDQQGYEPAAYNSEEYVEGDGGVYDGQQYPPDQTQYPEGYQNQQYTQEQFAEGPQEQYNQEQYPQEYAENQHYAPNPGQTRYDPNTYQTEQEYLEGEQNLNLQQGEYPAQEYQSAQPGIPNQIPPGDYPAQEYQSEPANDVIPPGDYPTQLQSDQPEQEDQQGPERIPIAGEMAANDTISENSDKLISSASESDKTGPIVQKTMPNLAEMLETDSESTKLETAKVSNDSDFEFSSSAQ